MTYLNYRIGLPSALFTVSLDTRTVARNLANFKPGTCQIPDGIPPTVVFSCGPDFLLLLPNRFTLSINSGIADQLEALCSNPHHKKRSLHDLPNFHPINHTPIIFRVMELAVKSPIVDYLLASNHLGPKTARISSTAFKLNLLL